MEENQKEKMTAVPETYTENTAVQNVPEGQASAPSELILGKFKSIDDLSEAYKELEKLQGNQSKELGNLRQQSEMIKNINQAWEIIKGLNDDSENLQAVAEKYNSPEYFQNPAFREIYKEAYHAFGKNLDPERLVNLLDGYVSSRLLAHEREISAKKENQNAVDSITFSQNGKSYIAQPKKRLDEMTPKEVDALLEKLI